MQNRTPKQWNALEMPLFRPPDCHKRIWANLPEPAKQQVIAFTAALIKQYQERKREGGHPHE